MEATTTLLVNGFLEEEDIYHMNWPARPRNINSIVHVWDALVKAVAGRQPPSQNLKSALSYECPLLPQAFCCTTC